MEVFFDIPTSTSYEQWKGQVASPKKLSCQRTFGGKYLIARVSHLFLFQCATALPVKVEQLYWKGWITLNGQLLKSSNFNGSHWAEDNQLFWQQNKLSSCSINVPKWPCTPVRCKSPKHFSSFDFLSYPLPGFIPLMPFEFRYLLFFTLTFKSLAHWLAINLAGIYPASFYICLYHEYQKCLVIWHW